MMTSINAVKTIGRKTALSSGERMYIQQRHFLFVLDSQQKGLLLMGAGGLAPVDGMVVWMGTVGVEKDG